MNLTPLPLFSLVRSELQLQTFNLLFAVLLVLSGLFGLFIVQNLPSENGVLAWGPFYLTRTLITIGFIIPIIQAVFVVKATARDAQYHMEELVFTTPVSKYQYLFSRWLGVFLPTVFVFIFFVIGLCAGLVSISLSTDISIDYGLLLSSLAWASLVFVLPAMLLSGVVLFAIGLFSCSAFIVYLAAGLSFFLYQLLSVITGSPTMAQPFVLNDTLKLVFDLFDPMASAEFYQQTKYWTVIERNTHQVALNGALLLNRLLVLITALVMALCSYRLFTLTLKSNGGKSSKKGKNNSEIINVNKEEKQQQLATTLQPAKLLTAITPSTNYYFSALFALVKVEYMTTVASKVFIAIIVAWSIMLGAEVLSGFSSMESLGVTSLATSTIAINRFIYDILPKFSALFLVLFAAEIMWRDKMHNIADLIDVTPISNAQRFMAKWLALVCIPLTFITVAIAISMLLQLIHGGVIEPLLYISLYVYAGIPLICVATLVLFINAVSANRIMAIVISLVVVILSQSTLGQHIGLEHGLFQFGSSPTLMHSEMIGFSAATDAFWGYSALWLSLSVLLALVSFTLMNRGHSTLSVKQLVSLYRQRSNKGLLTFTLLFSLLSVVSAGHVYYQTNVIGNYQSTVDHLQWRADYEKNYAMYRDKTIPSIIDVKTVIDLYPHDKRYNLSATFVLKNNTNEAISEVLISTHRDVKYTKVALENAILVKHDKVFNQYIYQLNTPLQPLQRIELRFEASRIHNGYNGVVADSLFTDNFVYFRDVRYMPRLGFSTHYTLQSNRLRQEYNLPRLPKPLTLEQDIEKFNSDFSEQYRWASIDTQVTTHKSHTAVAPGVLISKAVVNDRNVFHYKTEGKIRHIQPIISGKLSVSQRDVNGTSVEVYHLEKHSEIAQEHLDSMADTLKYGNEHFGQYTAKQLRLFEMPNVLRVSGYAMPQMMLLDERLGFVVDREKIGAFDHLYRRTAHETAHQWWGHGLDSAITEGGSMMVETLAVYTQAKLLDQKYGPEYMNRLLQYANDRYFFGRGQSREVEKPLYRASEKHLIYSKGTVAMHALQQKLGANKVNDALKHMLQAHRYPAKPATSLDFIYALNLVTEHKYQDFIDYWLKTTAVNDWQLESAEVTTLPNGDFNVAVCASNQMDNSTIANDVALTLTVGIFTENPASFYDKPLDERTLLQGQLTISSKAVGKSEMECGTYQVAEKPRYIVIDPYYQTLDQRRDNNLLLINKDDK